VWAWWRNTGSGWLYIYFFWWPTGSWWWTDPRACDVPAVRVFPRVPLGEQGAIRDGRAVGRVCKTPGKCSMLVLMQILGCSTYVFLPPVGDVLETDDNVAR
jgi:hypothetical protein